MSIEIKDVPLDIAAANAEKLKARYLQLQHENKELDSQRANAERLLPELERALAETGTDDAFTELEKARAVIARVTPAINNRRHQLHRLCDKHLTKCHDELRRARSADKHRQSAQCDNGKAEAVTALLTESIDVDLIAKLNYFDEGVTLRNGRFPVEDLSWKIIQLREALGRFVNVTDDVIESPVPLTPEHVEHGDLERWLDSLEQRSRKRQPSTQSTATTPRPTHINDGLPGAYDTESGFKI